MYKEAMGRRAYGTGQVYEKSGSYYGRWRTPSGRRLNRKIGPVRTAGEADGLTRSQAERRFRSMQQVEESTPRPEPGAYVPSVDELATSLRERLELRGTRKSYHEACEYMQRVHVSPHLGCRSVTDIATADVEALGRTLLKGGMAPKSVRNILGFLHAVFEHGIDRGWLGENPARRAEKPKRRSSGGNPHIQFLSVTELDAVIKAIPDRVVTRAPASIRRGRRGPAPPPSPDVLGPVLRVVILTAAMTGLRESELLGLRWCDVDWAAQRIRVRNTFVRGEHSNAGKSDLATRRSVPMADRLAGELDRWSKRTAYRADGDLVFAHPQTGAPLDRSKLSKRFKAACRAAGVREVKFHDLRHTFATRLAASGQPMRTIQEFLGHADSKTTQIYAHYAPSRREVEMVNDAFAPEAGVQFGVQSEADSPSVNQPEPHNHGR
jgi:integrase